MRNFENVSDYALVRLFRLSYRTLTRYQSRKAFNRLYFVVAELDKRGIRLETPEYETEGE